MAHKASDGRGFTNRSDMKRHERKLGLKQSGDPDNHDPESDVEDPKADYGAGKPGATTKRPAGQRNAEPEEPEGMDDNDGAPELLEDNMENPDGAEMHDEHGPAHKVVIQHDEASGMHMVQTDHPDGHSSMTQHGSAEAAHKYGKDCAGA